MPVDGEGQAALLLQLPRPAVTWLRHTAMSRTQSGVSRDTPQHLRETLLTTSRDMAACPYGTWGGRGGGVAGRGWRDSQYTPPCHLKQSWRAPAA